MEVISFYLRVAAPFVAGLITILCFVSLRTGRRDEHPLIILKDEKNGTSYPVIYWENSIGRSRGSDIKINDATVSRDHAVLLRRRNGWLISDTGSKAGVLVNGQPTTGRAPVAVGDTITLGNTSLVLQRAENAGKSSTAETKSIPSAFLLLLLTLFSVLIGGQNYINCNDISAVLPVAGFVAVSWIFFLVSRLALRRSAFEIEILALMLSGTGITLAASHDLRRAWIQLAAMVIGIALYVFMLWFIEIPDRVMKWHIGISAMTLVLLASSIAFGSVLNGARNWIVLGPIMVQPSEFAKIAYIFVGASTLDILQTKKSLTEFILVSAMSVGLLIFMGDFGTALIFFVTFLIISFMRSGDIKTVILAVTGAVLGAGVMLSAKPYIADRFKAWGHVWEYANDEGYQQVHSLIYSASGGMFGVGTGKGWLQYLFASENDLVFCLMCEEMGCLLAILTATVIGGFMLYSRGMATRSRSTFYSITACSAGGLMVFQAMLNIFGVTDILPLTGVTLPFVSYGGSSMAACWGLLAFIKASDERTYQHKKAKPAYKENSRQRIRISEKEEMTEI